MLVLTFLYANVEKMEAIIHIGETIVPYSTVKMITRDLNVDLNILMIIGFALAGYAIIANDSIQTLGTFIASNSHRPWWLLWGFASTILVVVVLLGWSLNQGDPAYGRLEKFPWPEQGIQWYHIVPPFIILILTRFGVPVSTTFMVLIVFNPKNIEAMLAKSVIGYIVAFGVAIVTYRFVMNRLSEHFLATREKPVHRGWIVAQWLSTAFLWSQWLIQDLANIFVYVPRSIDFAEILTALVFLVVLQGFIFKQMGGQIQKIVNSKTGTADIRAACIIDFIYGFILLIFKEWSNMPMSTTWVFLGLLAGRQLAISLHMYQPPLSDSAHLVMRDAFKAFVGLALSVLLAVIIPFVA